MDLARMGTRSKSLNLGSADPRPELSKDWTAHARDLESAGKFARLLAEFPHVQSARGVAGLARAAAFTGDASGARHRLQSLASFAEADVEAQIVAELTRSALARQDGDHVLALSLSTRAREAAQAGGWLELEADARFAMAISQVERSQAFLALDAFQSIKNDERLAPYRRQLASINFAWLMWDLGRVDRFREIKGELPDGYRVRIDLCLAMLAGERAFIQALLKTSACTESLPDSERFHIATLLTESIVVWQLDTRLAHPWLTTYLGRQSSPARAALARACLSLLGQPGPSDATLDSSPASPPSLRTELKLGFFQALQAAIEGNLGVSQMRYQETLDRLDKQEMQTPLIPLLQEGALTAHSPWAEALVQRLRWPRLESAHVPRARLAKTTLELTLGGTTACIDLSRSPVSIRLLHLLAGPAGRQVSKRQLHEQLTSSRYASDKHDGRLRKLLARINERAEAAGLPPLAYFPRNHMIHSNYHLEVQA